MYNNQANILTFGNFNISYNYLGDSFWRLSPPFFYYIFNKCIIVYIKHRYTKT